MRSSLGLAPGQLVVVASGAPPCADERADCEQLAPELCATGEEKLVSGCKVRGRRARQGADSSTADVMLLCIGLLSLSADEPRNLAMMLSCRDCEQATAARRISVGPFSLTAAAFSSSSRRHTPT